MKKVLIALAIILAIFLAIPLVGNKVIDETLNDRIELLSSYGLEVKKSHTDTGYLSTKKHYIFVVNDSKKFIGYLNQFSDTQLPPYVDALIDGAQVGLDVKYSNIPIQDKVSIDIYPNELSKKIAKDLMVDDVEFYRYIDALLKNKAIVYHINYDVFNNDFDGYIKNIDESHTLQDASILSLKLQEAKFQGYGMLIAPESLSTNIQEFALSIQADNENVHIQVNDFVSSSVFESKTTYASTGKFGKIIWSIKDTQKTDIALNMDNVAFDFSSNTQSVKADFFAKLSFDSMDVKTSLTKIKTKKFNYDIALRGVSKDSYEKLVQVIAEAKLNTTLKLEAQLEEVGYELIGRGMVLEVADLSIKEITTAKTKNLGGMSLKSKIVIKQDNDLAKKVKTNPIALIKLMDIDLLFTMSKNMYEKIALASPVLMMAQNFAKEEKELIIFDIKLKDTKLSVNGKEIK